MAESSSGRSLKPNPPRELKLGYVLWLQRLKKTPGNAVGGKGLMHARVPCPYFFGLHEGKAPIILHSCEIKSG